MSAAHSGHRAVAPVSRSKESVQRELDVTACEILRCISILRRLAREADLGDVELEERLWIAAEALNATPWPTGAARRRLDRALWQSPIPVIARGVRG